MTRDTRAHPYTPARAAPEQSSDEAALVRRLKAGDEAAFEQLILSASPRLLALARRMMSREEDARDAVQDAFLSAFKSIDRFDGRSQLTTWLHRITVNACLMKRRSQRRRPERSIEDLLPQFLDDGHHRSPARPWKTPPADSLEQAETLDLVRARIDELPEPYREIIILRDIEELDTDETASLLDLSAAAVKTRLHRARQALRTLLDPHFAEEQP
ncbi:MAG: sigma-70 family RNA polymerase sigma factor [Phycisphaerae bacterium]|nr:sigma-70 family RNA polymerase sigma factor [Phycisphaerae bacterium]